MRLAERIAGEIQAEGPITLARYMALCLSDPVEGYYTTRETIGRGGDFVTAPEVSQMFGEMLGLWAAHAWTLMGAPAPVRLVELGPGRGTLSADMRRAARALPAFAEAIDHHLVETSPPLRAMQADALGVEGFGVSGATSPIPSPLVGEGRETELRMSRFGPVTWHDTLDSVPDGPAILVANEFLDALPFRQFETRDGAWHERLVGIDAYGRFALGLSRAAAPVALIPPAFAATPDGAVFERAPEREALAAEVGARLVRRGGVALFVDYGHARSGLGDTFQAVRGHAYADPLQAPGLADLTSHVDFEAIAAAARAAGATVFPAIPQGAFLKAIGIGARAEALARGKTRDVADGIAADLARLTAPDAMGDLFKVLCIASPGLAPPPFVS